MSAPLRRARRDRCGCLGRARQHCVYVATYVRAGIDGRVMTRQVMIWHNTLLDCANKFNGIYCTSGYLSSYMRVRVPEIKTDDGGFLRFCSISSIDREL